MSGPKFTVRRVAHGWAVYRDGLIETVWGSKADAQAAAERAIRRSGGHPARGNPQPRSKRTGRFLKRR